MPIRRSAPEGDEPFDDDAADDAADDLGEPADDASPIAGSTWRVDRTVIAAKIVGVAAFAGIPQVFETNVASRWFGIVVAAALAVYLIRDLVAPVRLAADAEGVTVIHGFAGHRRIAWAAIEGVRVDTRRRSGFLEIETAESLNLFSRYDLGMSPSEAAEILERIRPARP